MGRTREEREERDGDACSGVVTAVVVAEAIDEQRKNESGGVKLINAKKRPTHTQYHTHSQPSRVM